MDIEQNLALFQELLCCGNSIYTWRYDADGNLLSSNCPEESLFGKAFSLLGCLKKAGMPLREIKAFMDWSRQGDATIGRRLDLIEKQRQSVLDQQKQLEDTLLMLDYKRWYYQTAQEAGTCAVHDSLTPEQVPERFRALMAEWEKG